jgi:hypothetical protein
VTVTQPCVSPDIGTLSPDLRVFYQYGMVLGLDDFVQEQTHNLGLDYHHERALHGYGTVYGLHVTTSTPPDAPDDVTLTVETGMGIDQQGREFTVPSAQCARLGAWLAAQEQASPGTIEANLGTSGELVVYVTGAYAECSDDLIPLPGQPCSTSSQVQKPSRLRDAWDIQLSWTPPAMPAWDAVRRLARLLNSIQLVSGPDLSLASDEQSILDAVRALASPAIPSGSPPVPVSYQLPADAADAAFDRIFTVWVTEVRPQLAPDLTAPDPNWDPSILLATVTFTPQIPFSTSSPVISSYADPDDTGRPYLLHTGLIQELRLGGQAGTAQPAPPLVQQAVTLGSTVNSNGGPTLTAWFHLPAPVSLPATIQVTDQNGQTAAFTTEIASGAGPFSSLWTLAPPSSGFTVTDGDQLTATFPGPAVLVGDNATTLAAVAATGTLLDVAGSGDLTAYTTVRGPVPASVSFVTVSFVPVNANSANIELWFHPQPQGVRENVFITLTSPSVEVINDLTGALLFPLAGQSPVATANHNIWTIPMSPTMLKTLPAYYRLVFSTEHTMVNYVLLPPIGPPVFPGGINRGLPITGRSIPLADWINFTGIRYVGWEGSDIVAFARLAATAAEGTVGD